MSAGMIHRKSGAILMEEGASTARSNQKHSRDVANARRWSHEMPSKFPLGHETQMTRCGTGRSRSNELDGEMFQEESAGWPRA